jgi:tyrosyl-tRNA synthetase
MEKTMEGAQFNAAKELLAYELTKLVHGEEEAEKAKAAAKALFGGSGSNENMPVAEIDSADLTDGSIGLLNLLVKAELAPSVSEARRLVQQGGITVNDEKKTDPKEMIALDGEIIVRKGKKAFKKVIVK